MCMSGWHTSAHTALDLFSSSKYFYARSRVAWHQVELRGVSARLGNLVILLSRWALLQHPPFLSWHEPLSTQHNTVALSHLRRAVGHPTRAKFWDPIKIGPSQSDTEPHFILDPHSKCWCHSSPEPQILAAHFLLHFQTLPLEGVWRHVKFVRISVRTLSCNFVLRYMKPSSSIRTRHRKWPNCFHANKSRVTAKISAQGSTLLTPGTGLCVYPTLVPWARIWGKCVDAGMLVWCRGGRARKSIIEYLTPGSKMTFRWLNDFSQKI